MKELKENQISIKTKKGYWSDRDNQREFISKIAKKFNLHSTQDWSKVTVEWFREHGGSSILNYYGGSLANALQTLYPSIYLFGCKTQLQQMKSLTFMISANREVIGKIRATNAFYSIL